MKSIDIGWDGEVDKSEQISKLVENIETEKKMLKWLTGHEYESD